MQADNHESDASKSAGKPIPMASGLYVIATPIGNLGDITLRAIKCLQQADLIACEDTRVTGRLLEHCGIKGDLVAYHEHSAQAVRPRLLAELSNGRSVALVSDAGTPCMADPGFKLVQEAAEIGIPILAVPGPSSITAALSIAGLPTDRHYFDGFLPNRSGERQRRLESLKSIDATLVFLESPHRILDSLDDAINIMGNRRGALARELTKRFEEVLRGSLDDIRQVLAARPSIKGELVLLIDRVGEDQILSQAEIDQAILEALVHNKPSRAAAKVSQATGIDRELIYKRVLELKAK